jgi:hypothetical protein
MVPRRKQIGLFLLCAAVLLAGGYGWGYASAYTGFYSLASLVDRESPDLDFNSRLLHYADVNQPEAVRARIFQRLSEQVRYIDQLIAASDDRAMAQDGSLLRARAALSERRSPGVAVR